LFWFTKSIQQNRCYGKMPLLWISMQQVAIDVAQNRPLWWLMSTFSATHS